MKLQQDKYDKRCEESFQNHHQLRNLNKPYVNRFTGGCSVVFRSISAEYILHTKNIVKERKKANIRN